ncbi:MAG TPA: hypothetical protein VMV12_03740 [Candidatus Micrarchaeaceae archaeon]|nr:hypothetical protein [Candidatus Micrarchaeaceae archaeon]
MPDSGGLLGLVIPGGVDGEFADERAILGQSLVTHALETPALLAASR